MYSFCAINKVDFFSAVELSFRAVFPSHLSLQNQKKVQSTTTRPSEKKISSNKKSPKNFPTFLRRKTNFLFPCKTKIEKIAKKIFLHIKPINLYSILHHWLRDFHWKIVSRIVFSNWFVKKKWKEKYYTQHIFSLIKLFLCFSLSQWFKSAGEFVCVGGSVYQWVTWNRFWWMKTRLKSKGKTPKAFPFSWDNVMNEMWRKLFSPKNKIIPSDK